MEAIGHALETQKPHSISFHENRAVDGLCHSSTGDSNKAKTTVFFVISDVFGQFWPLLSQTATWWPRDTIRSTIRLNRDRLKKTERTIPYK